MLLVAEGSGGHLIPALEVADRLARRGAAIKVWYAERRQTSGLAQALTDDLAARRIDVTAIRMPRTTNMWSRAWQCGRLWQRSLRCLDSFMPDVVVGFGGWFSAPVVLSACRARTRRSRHARVKCLLHEQNVNIGRANRLLARWVDGVAVSFPQTTSRFRRAVSMVTGMPVRQAIGRYPRESAAGRFGLDAQRPTLLVLGGSQGSRAINTVVMRLLESLTEAERRQWQFVHLTGEADESQVRSAYAALGLTAWVAPFLAEMEAAYAQADVVLARAGASTVAELARCGLPAVLMPYPHAGAHQMANAETVDAVGGGIILAQERATPERVLGAVRKLLEDERLRAMMGRQMRLLDAGDAAERLSQTIIELALK